MPVDYSMILNASEAGEQSGERADGLVQRLRLSRALAAAATALRVVEERVWGEKAKTGVLVAARLEQTLLVSGRRAENGAFVREAGVTIGLPGSG
ncbi:hypothetical protein GGTG_07694 [Gaeumannomyces tritici R3-111a-1]|uniref:Uncharacterized protein n=1 Tax=Gaeumannomyces tritici (strain R3-111a-1) TaxID=644352 RepID=J3P2E7_GAET3|nr:hypothetical protein GGTG_07694 [Gaeumannomyces tritici R3-111a-1]EJT73839.1 hypothetical protein GGTG_07694 [Gaeumannomyces tritici R3-111a-1]